MLEHNNEMNETTSKEVKKKQGEIKSEKSVENTNKVHKVSPSLTPVVKNTAPVVLTSEELSTLDYADFNTPARMIKLAEVLVKSQLVPLTKPEDVVVALMTGKELGLPFITSLSQIYPINGRPTLGVHIQKAILLKNGITFKKTEDAIEIYQFAKKIGDKFEVLLEETVDKQPEGTKKKHIGFRTTYELSREILRPSGNYKEMTVYGSFSTMEAKTADLLDKDVWQKYYKRMLDARAFTIGAREIADDLLLGIYSPSELSDDYYVNKSGEEVHHATVVEDA